MNFDEIPMRMMKLGVDRPWLSHETGYSPDTLRQILAPNGNPKAKSDRALKTIWEVLDREEARQQNPVAALELNQVVLRPNEEEFTNWNARANKENMLIKDWCMQALNRAAAQILAGTATQFANQPTARTGIDETPYKARNAQIIELPLLRAAAGAPILGDAEMVEVDRDYGKGRFLLELRGDSMEPQFHDRQRVILRDKSTLKRPLLKYGEYYAFVVDGLVTFKQWAKTKEGNKVLHSINPEHADIPADENTDWIGWYDAKDNA